jgi:hypothetical protein
MRPPVFTAVLMLTVLGAGLASGALRQALPTETMARWGFAPSDLLTGGWSRLLTSLPLLDGPSPLGKGLFLIAISCAPLERRHGWRRTAAAFLILHLATLVIGSAILLAFAHGGLASARTLLDVRDAGPSAGGYGCLALAALELPPRWRLALLVGIAVVGGVNVTWHAAHRDLAALSGDAAHALALLLGWLLRPVLLPRPYAVRPEGKPCGSDA